MGLMWGHRVARDGDGGVMLAWLTVLLVQLLVVGQISCTQDIEQTSTKAREGVFLVPWHLAKRARVGKRAPAADPGGVSQSVTANMDTLRNRLLWSLQNNHRQISVVDTAKLELLVSRAKAFGGLFVLDPD